MFVCDCVCSCVSRAPTQLYPSAGLQVQAVLALSADLGVYSRQIGSAGVTNVIYININIIGVSAA